ncbi:MFS transporter [Ectobacillus ponti]|uniref:MFS transporter n=1 Tax=Ectobacillus ponti TaxID=2961894 RepID=A0AA41X732_9BACI|nr:MFS transporter [Ectobacillus ponti]MCP8970139.1 MFS transporter [Ectobacillus ponti]
MYTRLKQLFAMQGYGVLMICMLLVGIGFSITSPYIALYCTEKIGMNAGAFGAFTAARSVSGVAFLYYIILSAAAHSWQLIAAQLLQATFVAIVMGNGLSYFTELLPESPGLATTIYSNGSTIGRLAGNLGGGMLAQAAGLRHVYEICLVVVLLSFLILWSSRPAARAEEKNRNMAESSSG